MKHTAGKGGSNHNAAAKEIRRDRKSGTGMSGSPKKGGYGGKFTWSGTGYSPAELGKFDRKAVDSSDVSFEDSEVAAN